MIIPKNYTDLPDDIRSIVAMIGAMFDEIYLVGGAVRDVILNKSVTDLDFTTPEKPDAIVKILSSNSALKVHLEGIEFGTVSANIGRYEIQITTHRTDIYDGDSRRPIVSINADIDDDLSRRDFTINAMALSRSDFIDPYDGITDIDDKRIVAVGDANVKFREDPLRIIRAFRFVSELGFSIEDITLSSAMSHRAEIKILPKERIGIELQKLLKGSYWDDALVELAESKVGDSLLNQLGIPYGLSEEDVYHEFSEYTAEQLREMELAERWLHFIQIVDHGRVVSGVQSVDIVVLADKILKGSQVNKTERLAVIELIDTSIARQHEKLPLDNNQEPTDFYSIAVAQKNESDPRWMINMAIYEMRCGKEALVDSRYSKAVTHFKKAIEISQTNQQYILETFSTRPIEKAEKLKGLGTRLKERFRYFILAIIFADNLYSKFKSSHDLAEFIYKNYKIGSISDSYTREVIEHVIASVYKRSPHGLSMEPFIDFINRDNLSIDKESVVRYKRAYIEKEIRDHGIPAREKAGLYLQKAQLSENYKILEDRGFEYYDPYIDYLYNMMISSQDMEEFNTYFDTFARSAEEYLQLASRWGRLPDAKRNMHLTSASALIYAIKISQDIEMQHKLSRRVVDDYRTGRDFRNARRYQVYVDWFSFISTLLHTASSGKVIDSFIAEAKDIESIGYVDGDEAYLREYRPDLYKKRQIMREVVSIFADFQTQKNVELTSGDELTDHTLRSISNLVEKKLIEKETAFVITKSYLAQVEKQSIEIDQIDLPDKLLTSKRYKHDIGDLITGETEILEYKSTWTFDLGKFRYTKEKIKENNLELKKEVVKNIAGMMNKSGGTILIGVEDNGSICGLEAGDFIMQSSKDPRKKIDNIQLDINQEIENRLSKEVLAQVSINVLDGSVDESKRTIIKIDLHQSQHGPILYRDDAEESYFVRSGTSTKNAGMKSYAEAVFDFRRRDEKTSV